MPRYAQHTNVPEERSRAEIESMLRKYGADQFMSGYDDQQAMIGFRVKGRVIKLQLPFPDKNSKQFTTKAVKGSGDVRRCTEHEAAELFAQERRVRWRALVLIIKAKLEAIESGISDFDREFVAHMVLPDGSTVGDWLLPQIDQSYANGRMPERLTGHLLPPARTA